MPYEWQSPPPPEAGPAPLARLHLWPYRSLPKRGYAWFIGATAALLALPLLTVIGSPILWGLLPFLLLALWAIWYALGRSYRDGEIVEDLTLWPDRLTLSRHGPRNRRQDWQANPHWVRVTLHPTAGPVPQYLTLSGNGREVEIGAFLSEDERLALYPELTAALARAR
jgi:uncharacterized membrane protein